jgi:hypothetical protein
MADKKVEKRVVPPKQRMMISELERGMACCRRKAQDGDTDADWELLANAYSEALERRVIEIGNMLVARQAE